MSSLGFLVIVAIMVTGRFLEQRSGYGLNSFGEVSTWQDFKRYTFVVVPMLIGVWCVLNSFGGVVK